MMGQNVYKPLPFERPSFTRFFIPSLNALHFLHENACSLNRDRLKVKGSVQVAVWERRSPIMPIHARKKIRSAPFCTEQSLLAEGQKHTAYAGRDALSLFSSWRKVQPTI